ncbi:MAG TPA: tetratricopeptide repeat protein [Acidobacteriaceae bacterium]|jgi:tetratricopeptide (TPR) repeat protein|nr:tetratricopeptide repeat protein [Acidobacteriaceae bacterium]
MKRRAQAFAILLLGAAFAPPLFAVTPPDCWLLTKHGHQDEAKACYQSLTQAHDPYLRAEGDWGLQLYDDANNEFRAAVAQSPDNANDRVRWGMLLHERFNNTDAEGLFNEALKIDPKDAQAYLGLAILSEDGYDDKAVEYTARALTLDPKLVEAHELMANIALEDSDPAGAAKEADAAIQLSPDALDAMAVHAAIEVLADRPPDAWLEKIRQVNPSYGEGYAIVAHHLVLNYRYEDAVDYYRKAIAADPGLWSARSELGINLMRLGQEDEPRQQLEMCYNNGYRDAATVNSLRLLDSYKDFVTFKDDTTILKLKKSEAALLYPYFEDVLKRAIATYQAKYKMTLPGPVQVEVYPDHEDFAVRTLGMPGLGALGVTFGEVVAMDSPSAAKPGDSLWASVLWHEMSHVYILTATNHRVPRWFTEGLAVHEETQASPEWGDRMTPDIVVALRDKKLLPVADLDRGFVRPEFPDQVLVSYYEAGRICDYIQSRWGADKLLAMAHSFGQLKTTPEVIQQDLGVAPEQFDKDFQTWLYQQDGGPAAHFDEWVAKLKDLAQQAQNKNYAAVLQEGETVRQLYPQYLGDANAYEFMADAYQATGDKKGEAAILTQYEKIGGRSPARLKELAALEESLGEPAEAAATLDRINYIDPVGDEDLHRHLGNLWLAQKNYAGAIREYNAVLASHPLDVASAHFNLAQAYLAAGQRDKAQDNVLQSLEAAPDYRPAQQMLLELQDSEKGK